MWGPSPIVRVMLNGQELKCIQPGGSKFIYVAAPRNGTNTLRIELDRSQTHASPLKIISQFLQVQFNRPGAGYSSAGVTQPKQVTLPIGSDAANGSGGSAITA
ncbi:hypothetical protein AAVH_05503 [Aphelenchoides avenae]|nr:hypothetical protein AAVH_05503 [Aphelenchus avenae]